MREGKGIRETYGTKKGKERKGMGTKEHEREEGKAVKGRKS